MPETVRIVCASTQPEFDVASRLFLAYAEELGWDLSSGGRLADEIAAPPGPYSSPTGALLLAYVAEKPAGVLGLQAVPSEAIVHGVGAQTAGELKRLFVCPEFRRHGVGRALLARAEDEARRLGYDSLVLTTSEEMFPLAQGVYDSLGYHATVPYRDDMPYPHIRWLSKKL